jgi:hypothetical protein
MNKKEQPVKKSTLQNHENPSSKPQRKSTGYNQARAAKYEANKQRALEIKLNNRKNQKP